MFQFLVAKNISLTFFPFDVAGLKAQFILVHYYMRKGIIRRFCLITPVKTISPEVLSVDILPDPDIINLNKVDAIYNNYLCLGQDLFFIVSHDFSNVTYIAVKYNRSSLQVCWRYQRFGG